MDDEATAMREQMDETLDGLTDKLEQLETQISGTVRTVKDSVNRVRNTFDLKSHVRQHPWTLLGGAMALGFLGGYRSGPSRSGHATQNRPPSTEKSSPDNLSPQSSPSRLANLADRFQPEIAAVKGIAAGAVIELAHEIMRKQVVAPISRAIGGDNTEVH